MRRLIGIGAAVLAGALGAVWLCPEEPRAAAAESRPGTVRIGLVGTLFPDTPEPLMQVMIRPFKSLLESQTGVRGHVVVGGDARSVSRQLKEDRIQLAVFHGVEFAWVRGKNPQFKPLLIAVNKNRTLHALLVVRSDSKAASHADLEGKAVALPRLSREHCRLFLEHRCVKAGTKPCKYYSQVATPSDTQDAVDDVVDGKVDAAVVDANEFGCYRKLKPGRANRVKTIARSEPFPSAVIVYQPGVLSESLLQRFRDGMIGARSTRHGRQLLDMCRITAFESVPDNYDRLLTSIAKAYPPPAEPDGK